MSRPRPRVIFDCNVLLQAILSPDGPSFACLRLVEERRILLLASPETIAEARGVLNRPFVHERLPELSPEQVELFLGDLTYVAEEVRDVPHVQAFPRDPKDEPYLNLAIAGRADYLVTRDNDLLSLNSDHTIEANQFRQRHQNRLRVLTPDEFLDEIRPDRPSGG